MPVGVPVGRYLIETLCERGGKAYVHWCSGCGCCHLINVEKPTEKNQALWSFNGNFDSPTFAPSIDIGRSTSQRCHYFVEDGSIRYTNDTHHNLKGKTVPMNEFPQHVLDAYAQGTARANDLMTLTAQQSTTREDQGK